MAKVFVLQVFGSPQTSTARQTWKPAFTFNFRRQRQGNLSSSWLESLATNHIGELWVQLRDSASVNELKV